MRLLLDTQVFAWHVTADEQLNANTRRIILDPGNEVFLSVISLWEINIKYTPAN